VFALLLGGTALLCASFPSLCGLVVILGSIALVLGFAGIYLALTRGQFRLAFPIAGTAAGGGILLAGLMFPELLGSVYLASRAKDTIDPTAIRVVSLANARGSAESASPDWVDATACALQQGRLRIQIVSVAIRPMKEGASPAQKLPPGRYLFIRLRIHQAEGADKAPEKPALRLTDPSGKVYAQQDVREVAAAPTGRKVSPFRAHFNDEVFAFVTPPPGLEYLRLEVPVESWGGKGVFRFTIPRRMIGEERAGTVTSSGGR
jgi:hypothetical protein